MSLLLNSGGESLRERRDLLLEHDSFIKKKVQRYQKLSQLIEKKLDFYNDALSSDDESVRCMDYATEWEHFRNILGGIEHD